MFCFTQVENTLAPSVKHKIRYNMIDTDKLTKKRIKNSSEWTDVK